MDYYNLLNLPFDATADEVRSAYFNAARKYHPDAASDLIDSKLFIRIQQAYEVLADSTRRKQYDLTIPEQAKTKSAVLIETVPSRTFLHGTDQPQLFYALINIFISTTAELKSRPPVHLCIILDRSTSMRGDRIEMVQGNLSQLFRWLRPSDIVSVIAFSDRADVVIEPTALSNLVEIENKLGRLDTGGATEIYQGLELGFEVFKRYGGKGNPSKHLMLITDGHTYGDEERCYQLAERIHSEGVIFNAIGIGEEWNDVFLDKLASLCGGTTHYIRDRQELTRLVERKVKSLQTIFARKAELHLSFPERINLNYAYKIQPDVNPLESTNPIQIGAIEYNKKLSVILEIKIDRVVQTDQDHLVAGGKLWIDVTGQPIPAERHSFSIALPVRDKWANEKVPPNIVNAMHKVSLYKLQEKAKEDVMSGDIFGATRHLKNLATKLISHGERELAILALREAEHLEKYGTYSKDGEKNIKYGTRELHLLPSPEIGEYD